MISPVNGIHPADVHPVVSASNEPRPDPHAATPPVPKSGQVSDDQVTLKSAGQPDTDRR